MTKLTTHVLDIYSGKPGKGIKVDLFFLNGENKAKINTIFLNNDGIHANGLGTDTTTVAGDFNIGVL